MAERDTGGWDDIDAEWEMSSESAPSEAEEDAALAASHAGDCKGQEPRHEKFNITLTNFGGARAKGEEMYQKNAFEFPVFVAICLETKQEHLEPWTVPCKSWLPEGVWTRGSSLAEPPQGFCGDARVKKWIATKPYQDLAVVGLSTRVESIEKLEAATIEHSSGANSRLLLVEVKWRTPIAGKKSIRIIAGHLHNTTATKPSSNDHQRFFDVVRDFCARGGRIFGADLNMAAFNAVDEMAKRHVGLTLLNHHCELVDPRGPYDKNSVLYDSMGLWIVGPFDIQRTRIISAAEHMFWGAAHPKGVTKKQCVCGHPSGSYTHPPPPPDVLSVE